MLINCYCFVKSPKVDQIINRFFYLCVYNYRIGCNIDEFISFKLIKIEKYIAYVK